MFGFPYTVAHNRHTQIAILITTNFWVKYYLALGMTPMILSTPKVILALLQEEKILRPCTIVCFGITRSNGSIWQVKFHVNLAM